MSSTEARSNHASSDAAAGTVDMHLEVQIIPVSGVDRSKQFYQRLGWRLDADVAPLDGLRIFQFTPPGLGRLGHVRHRAYHGRARLGRGRADRRRHRRGPRRPGRPRHRRERDLARPAVPSRGPAARPRPRAPATGPSSPFTDPDGNTWLVQEVTTRLPGCADAAGTAFPSAADLAGALRRAEVAHRAHEKRTGRSHLFSPAGPRRGLARPVRRLLVAERAGTDLPA